MVNLEKYYISTIMKVDYVLILAAGKGTRMGQIGQSIPKVIWPIFEKSILELEVAYAKKLAPAAKIFINVYHHKEKIIDHINQNEKSFHGIEILDEKEVLDIGGAVHNLAKTVHYNGNVLILNSDQFLFFNSTIIKEGLDILKENDALLFTYEVNSNDGYNALEIDSMNFQLKSIIKNDDLSRNKKVMTYTGVSLINLQKLEKKVGESKFFESVANFKKNKIITQKLDSFEYWDFGTLNRYEKSIRGLLTAKNSLFKEFLIENESFKEEKNYLFEGKITYSDFCLTESEIEYQNLKEKLFQG